MYLVECMDISKMSEGDLRKLWELSEEDRVKKAKRYYREEDQKRCLATGLLIKRFLQRHGDKVQSGILCNQYGKPYVANGDGLYFNISHSGKWVVIASGETEIGVDVEKICPVDAGVLETCFTQAEVQYVQKEIGEEALRFTKLWTLKESYLKYQGTGIWGQLKNLSFCETESGFLMKNDPNVSFSAFTWDQQYALSICGRDSAINPREIFCRDVLENEK